MSEGVGGRGGQLPPQILADQKAPHYYMPPQIFRLCNMPESSPFVLETQTVRGVIGCREKRTKYQLSLLIPMAGSNLGSNSRPESAQSFESIFVFDGTLALCHPDENYARRYRSLEVIATGEGLRLIFF